MAGRIQAREWIVREGDRYTKRCQRWDVPGQAHALTFGCYRGRSFLSKQRTCEWLVEAIDAARQRHTFELWAYVFMPDHVHLVVYPKGTTSSISRILSAIKQPVARRAIHYLREQEPEGLGLLATGQQARPYRFWQKGGGYDRNITQVATLVETIRYIHNNPVRRQLVTTATDWHYSSAAAWEGLGEGPLAIDRDSYPVF